MEFYLRKPCQLRWRMKCFHNYQHISRSRSETSGLCAGNQELPFIFLVKRFLYIPCRRQILGKNPQRLFQNSQAPWLCHQHLSSTQMGYEDVVEKRLFHVRSPHRVFRLGKYSEKDEHIRSKWRSRFKHQHCGSLAA